MIPRGIRTKRALGAVAVGLMLVGSCAAAVWLLARERSNSLENLRTSAWIAVQAHTEALRFLEAAAAFRTGALLDADVVRERFDIFWSRMPLMLEGADSLIISHVGMRAEASAIVADLPRLEMVLDDLLSGRIDHAEFRERFAPTREKLLDIVQAVLAWQVETTDRTRMLEVYSTAIGLLLLALGAGATLVTMLFRQLGRAEIASTRAEEAARERSRFLAAASHDLRQPLNAATLLLGALQTRTLDDGSAEVVRRIDAALARVSSQLNAYLDLTKLESGEERPNRAPVALGEMLEGLREQFERPAATKGLELRVVGTSALAITDPAMLERILSNLLSNAVKHTDAGGILVGCRRRGDRLRIDVLDTGPGIAAEERGKVFREFYQVGNRHRAAGAGHGLGLSIVERTARVLGHPLDLESVPGRGSRFSVTLPRADASPAPNRVEAAPAPVPPAPIPPTDAKRPGNAALVVEDDPLIAESLVLVLGEMGFEPLSATSAEDAIDMVRRSGARPDLIAADFRLPGLDGLTAIAEIRGLMGRPVPALLLTGDQAPSIVEAARRDRVVFLSKPISPRQLMHAIDEAGRPAA